MNDSNELFTDSYSVIDLKLSRLYSIKNLGINISTGINNLFDTRYASGIVINARGFGGRDPRFYYPGLPRNYLAIAPSKRGPRASSLIVRTFLARAVSRVP